jgi:cardiolipin synthase A/B
MNAALRSGLAITLPVALGLALAACMTMKDVQPAPSAPSQAPVAQRVNVTGSGGLLTPDDRKRALQSVADEGERAALMHHLGLLAQVGEVDLYRGNTAKLLVDGPATFKAMKRHIAAAKRRILLESYIFEDEGIAAEMATMLADKARDGVATYVMYDSVGSVRTDAEIFERMKSAGIAVCAFNPINPAKRPGYFSIEHRNHRKTLVVDGDSAFAGGINISQVYAKGSFGSGGSAKSEKDVLQEGWRDTQIELRGPAVAAFAEQFVDTWKSQGCQGTIVEVPVRVAQPGDRVVKVIVSSPDDPYNAIYASLLNSFKGARESIKITMAYFAPGEDMIQALCDAARRGVDVQLILPAKSDFKLILHAGRSYYSRLLEAGVKIFEMENSVLHAKTAVVDGVVGTVGSSNLDWRSFVANNEINVVVLGRDFGLEMEALFEQDKRASRQITREAWSARGLWPRTLELIGRGAERWL